MGRVSYTPSVKIISNLIMEVSGCGPDATTQGLVEPSVTPRVLARARRVCVRVCLRGGGGVFCTSVEDGE